MRGRERQHVARHAERFPRSAATTGLERLERARSRQMDRIRTREIRAPDDIRNARERTLLVSLLERLARLVAEAADVAPAYPEGEGGRGRGNGNGYNGINRRGAGNAEDGLGIIRFNRNRICYLWLLKRIGFLLLRLKQRIRFPFKKRNTFSVSSAPLR
jgi:hypothetical protein